MKTPSSPEPLESRIAPAVLVNPTTLTYTDIDGDKVTVTTSAGAFVFPNAPDGDENEDDDTFFLTGANAIGGQKLVAVNLGAGGDFTGADLTFSVVKAGAGDGLAAVGRIAATGIDLGTVTVKGDLGEIDCGDADTATPGLELLSVRSMGRYGDATDPLIPGLTSDIRGALGALRVAEDIKDARILVSATVDADAKIGSITIGGSLIGGAADGSGAILAGGDIGPVKIGRDVLGGDGAGSGLIDASGASGTVSIGGSMVGGSGSTSGRVVSDGGMGAVTIAGNLQGGTGATSGTLRAGGTLTSVTLGGSLLGGAGEFSARILGFGDIGPVKIAHDVKGGAGNESGKIQAGGKLGAISIGGSLLGGGGAYNTTATQAGQIFAMGDIGAVSIGHDVQGAVGDFSAGIRTETGKLSALTIGGSLLGGAGLSSAEVFAKTGIGAVKIGHDFIGGSADSSGRISSDGPLASVSLGGSLVGGNGAGTFNAGSIFSNGTLGAVTIAHDVLGGSGGESGAIRGGARIVSISIGGSLIGGSASSGATDVTGAIIASGGLGALRIGHDLVGGSISGTATRLERSGFIESTADIDSISIGGSIIAGTDSTATGDFARCATIRAGDDIGSIAVKGGLIGNVGAMGDGLVVISAVGQDTPSARADVAIGKITIGGRVEFAQIFAGYDRGLDATNADAQIGAVSVGGDWAGSSIVAGAINLGADDAPGGTLLDADNIDFGNIHDFKIAGGTDNLTRFSKIGSIAIAGQVFGTSGVNHVNQFAFVAEEVGALKIGGVAFALDAGRNNDGLEIGPSRNMSLHEIGAAVPVAPQPTAPARLVNASTVSYDDIDGDHVTVRFSKPLLTAGNVNTVFTFEDEPVGGANARQGLQLLDLRSLAAAGLSITITVVPGGGDGLANVGAILADEDLGTITVPGDLGQIAAGDANAATRGLAALTVRTFGRLGTDTQPAAVAGFTPFLGGDILGGLGALAVRQDFVGANLAITGALGSLTIGGSLIGGSAVASGTISAQSIGAVKIGQHVQAGAGASSGLIETGTSIASVSVGGSVIGGSINADGTTLGAVRIGHNIIGGIGAGTAFIGGNTGVGSVTIGGSFLGGLGASSGRIFSAAGGIGAVKVGHNVAGGAGDESGGIDSATKIAGVSLGGSLLGGAGRHETGVTGQITAGADLGAVRIAHNIHGGSGGGSATIHAHGDFTSVTVGGTVASCGMVATASILSDADLGPVRIAHGLLGSTGPVGARIFSQGNTGSVSIGGSLLGGGSGSGQVNGNASLGAVSIGHDVHGGSGVASGYIVSDGKIASVTIGGSLIGGSANLTGGIFPTDLGSVKIGRDLIGGSIAGTTATLERSGFIESASRIASVSIGGSIIAGIDDSTVGSLLTDASIRAGADLVALSVRGSLIGNVAPNGTTPVIISARGEGAPTATRDLAIGKVSIGGSVERALILGGYTTEVVASDTQAAHANNKAQIGAVTVGHDWSASSLVAGTLHLENKFGDGNDLLGLVGGGGATIARIASIVIGGTVTGTASAGDHFGFVSVTIGSFKSIHFTAPLTPADDNAIELSPITGDVTIREV